MTHNTTRQPASVSHRDSLDLLALYADLLQNSEPAAELYPAVARHLETCKDCNFILADLLTTQVAPEFAIPAPDKALDLSFLRQQEGPVSTLRRAIKPLEISFDSLFPAPLAGAFRSRSEQRSQSIIQPGGRLIGYKEDTLAGMAIEIMLTLHKETDSDVYDIRGELAGTSLPAPLIARLQVAEQTYVSDVKDGRLNFAGVDLEAAFDHILFELEFAD